MTDLNEMAENAKKREEALDALAELSQEMEKSRKIYEHDNDTWWNGLTEQEREDAFYAVCKRIWKADGIDNGTYRYGLYDVFGFDPGMYMRGMDCGYMAIHNAIYLYGGYSHPEWAGLEEREQEMRGILIELYDTGRLHQPRQFGAHPRRLPYYWLDTFAPEEEIAKNPAAQKAWDNYKLIAGLS